MFAKAAEVGRSTGLKLSNMFTRATTTFAPMNKNEVAEVLIATWCVEFLRMRRLGSFNVIEIVVVSALMLGVKVVSSQTGRGRHEGSNRTFIMSDELAPMEFMGNGSRSTASARWRPAGSRRYRGRNRRNR